jgi:antitoxin component YwqK of YwqJK toxin-antitoxin module
MSLVSFPSWGLTMDDLVQREGLYYQKFTDVPFTGEIDEGLERGNFKNGGQEGPWIGYWENGQLHFKGEYKNGKREGPWVEYYKNGQLLFKGNYRNGEMISE